MAPIVAGLESDGIVISAYRASHGDRCSGRIAECCHYGLGLRHECSCLLKLRRTLQFLTCRPAGCPRLRCRSAHLQQPAIAVRARSRSSGGAGDGAIRMLGWRSSTRALLRDCLEIGLFVDVERGHRSCYGEGTMCVVCDGEVTDLFQRQSAHATAHPLHCTAESTVVKIMFQHRCWRLFRLSGWGLSRGRGRGRGHCGRCLQLTGCSWLRRRGHHLNVAHAS